MIQLTNNKQRTIISRIQLVMLSLVSSSRPVPARRLAEEMEVSPQTIYRDIEQMRQMGFQTRVEINGEGGKGFSMDRCNCPFCGSQLKQN